MNIRNNFLIKVDNISKSFGKKLVLHEISLEVRDNENLAIIGGNGSGKTTLIEIMAGLTKPTKGKIIYNFKNKNFRQQIGIQFQDSSYPKGLKVYEIIYFIIGLYKVKLTEQELIRLIDIFGITSFYFQNADSLSGGQLQRLNLLLSLIHKPNLVFLDEISTGLDLVLKKRIYQFLKEYSKNEKANLVIISHDYDEMEFLADRIVVVKNGKIILDELKADILKKSKLSTYLKQFIY